MIKPSCLLGIFAVYYSISIAIYKLHKIIYLSLGAFGMNLHLTGIQHFIEFPALGTLA